MKQPSNHPTPSPPDQLQNLQRRLLILLGSVLLLMMLIIGAGLAYVAPVDGWEIWLAAGGVTVLVGAAAIWLVMHFLREHRRQQLAAWGDGRQERGPDRSESAPRLENDRQSESALNVATDGGDAKKSEAEGWDGSERRPPRPENAPNPAPLSMNQAYPAPDQLDEAGRELARLRQTEAELIQRNHELTIVQAAGVAMTSSLDLRYVLDTVVQEMTRLVGVDSCAIFEWDQPAGTISRVAKYDATGWWAPEALRQVRPLADYPLTRSVLIEQIPEQMTVSQPYLDPVELAQMQQANIKTRMLLPMIFQQRVVGLVELEDSRVERVFSAPEIGLVKLLANQAGSAIENARLYQQAQQEIAERERAEAALEQERALLAQRVEERTLELSKANAELARAARLKDEFLANMSHELRTPLNVILGSTELLQEEVFGELNEKQQKYTHNVHESGQHLLSLITDILDLSKIEAGRFDLEVGPVSVHSVCEASTRLVKQLAHKKQLNLSLNIADGVKAISADERRLKQVLVNLLSNAIKFTPAEGKVGLEVVGDAEKQVVHFTVWDTGIGIAPEDLTTLFEPFIQADSSLAREQEGTGLGLSLVSRLTELHGGGVSVESEVGSGSRFTVSLPWPEGNEVTDPAETVEPELPHEPEKLAALPERSVAPLILLAEDNEQNINMLLGYLEAQGYHIIIARNGFEAMARAREETPELILMDVQMPGLDGLEATRRLRQDSAMSEIPIIALTALAMPGDRERCLEAGATEYVSKPISPTGLVKTIETYLAGS